jgi:DNA-binding transcriptional MerR regulator
MNRKSFVHRLQRLGFEAKDIKWILEEEADLSEAERRTLRKILVHFVQFTRPLPDLAKEEPEVTSYLSMCTIDALFFRLPDPARSWLISRLYEKVFQLQTGKSVGELIAAFEAEQNQKAYKEASVAYR